MITSIIFDFDYTLADSSEAVIQCVNYALTTIGEPPARPDAIRQTIGLSLDETFRRFTARDIERCRTLFIEQADRIMDHQIVLLDGTVEVLEDLTHRGYRLGVATSKFRRRLELFFSRKNLRHYFTALAGAEEVTRLKPDPEVLLLILDRLGAARDEAVYVGDAVVDVQAARTAGIRSVAVTTGPTSEEALRASQPDAVIGHLRELAEVLAQWR